MPFVAMAVGGKNPLFRSPFLESLGLVGFCRAPNINTQFLQHQKNILRTEISVVREKQRMDKWLFLSTFLWFGISSSKSHARPHNSEKLHCYRFSHYFPLLFLGYMPFFSILGFLGSNSAHTFYVHFLHLHIQLDFKGLSWAERLILSLASKSAGPLRLLGVSSSWLEALQNGASLCYWHLLVGRETEGWSSVGNHRCLWTYWRRVTLL